VRERAFQQGQFMVAFDEVEDARMRVSEQAHSSIVTCKSKSSNPIENAIYEAGLTLVSPRS
jgi:hypothetical protein